MAYGDGKQLRGEDGHRLHVAEELTDAEVLNSPVAKAARVEMMQGQWPAACVRCQQVEEAGGESGRQYLNERFDPAGYAALLEGTAADGTIQAPVVRYADIRLGNVCNLTCRMCGPVASRLWAPIFNDLQPPAYQMPVEELTILGQNNWVKKSSVSWLLEQSLPHLEALHFAGGEPLILPEMVQALELLVRSGRAGEIELSYNTNLTVLPEKVTSLWQHFKSVSILASVDGFGRMTEYIRRPSKWKDIDRNLHVLDENFERWKINWVTVSCTVQIYNLLSLGDLFRYLRETPFRHVRPVPQLIPLYYPAYLSIQALPPDAKRVARGRLRAEIARAEARGESALDGAIGSMRATLAFLNEAETTADLDDFVAFCEKSDREFGDSWRETCPELARSVDGFLRRRGHRVSELVYRLQERLHEARA
jgi:pyruvate-formate lyase-activating enzyme